MGSHVEANDDHDKQEKSTGLDHFEKMYQQALGIRRRSAFVKWILTINYFRLHAGYIIGVCLFGGILLYLVELGNTRGSSMTFTDALFTASSAVTCTGLIVVDTSQLSHAGQVLIMLYILSGGTVFLSLMPVVIRTAYVWYRCRGVINPNKVIEYQALWWIVKMVVVYYLIWHSVIFFLFVWYVAFEPNARDILDRNDVSPIFWSFFHTISAFNNAGFALFADSMVQWSETPYILIWLMFLMLAGNLALPMCLRAIILFCRYTSCSAKQRAVFQYLLEYPRKCYTCLFPTAETIWLTLTLMVFTLVQFVVFIGVEWNEPLLEGFTTGQKLLNSLFSSIATRNTGFNTLNFAILQPATEVLIIVMMYLGVMPITVALRETEVGQPGIDYEVDISGHHVVSTHKHRRPDTSNWMVTAESEPDIKASDGKKPPPKQQKPGVGFHARKLLTTHATFLVLIIWMISLQEGTELLGDPEFSMFSLFFEVVSAYGNVGLSIGYPGTATSLSAVFHTFSKLLIICTMLLGKHRYLPESIDKAVNLPSVDAAEAKESLKQAKEMSKKRAEEQAEKEADGVELGDIMKPGEHTPDSALDNRMYLNEDTT